jgi:hypothetical protein
MSTWPPPVVTAGASGLVTAGAVVAMLWSPFRLGALGAGQRRAPSGAWWRRFRRRPDRSAWSASSHPIRMRAPRRGQRIERSARSSPRAAAPTVAPAPPRWLDLDNDAGLYNRIGSSGSCPSSAERAASVRSVDARDRFISAIAELVSTAYYTEGEPYISSEQLSAIAVQEHVPEPDARGALDLLDERGLLRRQEGGWAYSDGVGLLLRYEEAERRLHWQRNVLRREILRLAAIAYDDGAHSMSYVEGDEQFVQAPWAEAYAASKTLEYLGLIELRPFMGHAFDVGITPSGRELFRDNRRLSRELPINAAEDEDAAENVAPDVLGELILDVEALLAKRGWTGAERELARGDDQYREGDWMDAVREYYAAAESGLKHRLDEAGVAYGAGVALRDLARLAASDDLIPVNYQALFGFADSIRSPRSHGAGANVVEVEVGKAEALLMGNHVRALLLYLGQRPQ